MPRPSFVIEPCPAPQEHHFHSEEQSFQDLVRLLTDAHERALSALQSKVAELERSSGHRSDSHSRPFAVAATQVAGSSLRSPLGAPQPEPQATAPDRDEASNDDYMGRMMQALRAETPAGTSRDLTGEGCRRQVAAPARRLVRWPGFNACAGLIILANAVCIGVELEFSVQQRPLGVLGVLEDAFLAVYALELGLRALADGRKCFDDCWVRFDTVLLLAGLSSELLSGVADGWSGLDHFIVLRMLRLLRFFRAGRMAGRWKTLWKLVSGFLGSMETLASTLIALTFAVYVFTCLSMELITVNNKLHEDPDSHAMIQKYFNSFLATVMTTFQFVTMDGASDIYRPLINAQPLLALYFPLMIGTLPILLMNLVTAILVDDAISSSQMDEKMKHREMKRKLMALAPQIQRAFQILDKDGSGQIHMDEVISANFAGIPEVDGVSQLLTPQVLVELYDVLDADGNGFISEEELVKGVMQLALSEASLDITEVKHLVKANARHVRSLKHGIERIVMLLEGTKKSGSQLQ